MLKLLFSFSRPFSVNNVEANCLFLVFLGFIFDFFFSSFFSFDHSFFFLYYFCSFFCPFISLDFFFYFHSISLISCTFSPSKKPSFCNVFELLHSVLTRLFPLSFFLSFFFPPLFFFFIFILDVTLPNQYFHLHTFSLLSLTHPLSFLLTLVFFLTLAFCMSLFIDFSLSISLLFLLSLSVHFLFSFLIQILFPTLFHFTFFFLSFYISLFLSPSFLINLFSFPFPYFIICIRLFSIKTFFFFKFVLFTL
ncbi:unnamed protein product [Acanthosepion pharaonis]|uniref:Uncharacterized protein n=1 Tax=Acanthosepion pharaonis TaxID=158019 RepID=A0A812DWQ9_ACAPH|nr:unnamed protein product [Sepia pharaonis]